MATGVKISFEDAVAEATPMNDSSVEDAWRKALKLRRSNTWFDKAIADCRDGLVLLGASGKVYFRTLQCGSDSDRLDVTVYVLELLEFEMSDPACIMRKLRSARRVELYR